MKPYVLMFKSTAIFGWTEVGTYDTLARATTIYKNMKAAYPDKEFWLLKRVLPCS